MSKYKFSNNFQISNHKISLNSRTFIIAEVGINHEGSAATCLKMILEANKSGADIVKLQTIDPDASYEKGSISHRLFSKANITREELVNIYEICKKKKINIFSTFDKKNYEFFKKLNQVCYKISSSLSYDYYFIKQILKVNKPTIISTGLSDLEDISSLLNLLRFEKNKKIALLHCRSIYPTKFSDVNLSRIEYLRKKFDIITGFSDHCLGTTAAISSIYFGSKILEKHFTLDCKRASYDHKISLEPKKFFEMVKKIRIREKLIGVPDYKVFSKNENFKKMSVFIRSFKLKNDIKKNQLLKSNDFNLVRSKNTKNVVKFNKIIFKILKKKIKKNLKKNHYLELDDFKK